jgi:tellurite resistance protein
MAGFLQNLTTLYRKEVERHHNRPFLEAAMAACALVATARGPVTFAQRVRIDQILETLETLKVFDPHEGVEVFNAHAERILEHPRKGRARALATVRRATKSPDTARLLIQLCLAVSEMNDDTSLADQIEIVMLCDQIGVDPAELGLYVDSDPESIRRGDKLPPVRRMH